MVPITTRVKLKRGSISDSDSTPEMSSKLVLGARTAGPFRSQNLDNKWSRKYAATPPGEWPESSLGHVPASPSFLLTLYWRRENAGPFPGEILVSKWSRISKYFGNFVGQFLVQILATKWSRVCTRSEPCFGHFLDQTLRLKQHCFSTR